MSCAIRNLMIVIASLVLITGCVSNTTKSSAVTSRIEHSLEKGNYKYAFTALMELRSDASGNAQKSYRDYLEKYPNEFNVGGQEYVMSNLKSNAIIYGTLEEFSVAMQEVLDKYKIVSTGPDYDSAVKALREEFNNSRKRYPIIFPAEEVVIGLSQEEFYKIIPKTPIKSVNVYIPSTPPTDFVVNEYTFLLPDEYKSVGDRPIWVAFRDKKVAYVGHGNSKDAEYLGYQWYISEDLSAGRIKRAPAMRILYEKYKETYGTPNVMTQEYMAYLIMVYEKLDSRSITQSEAEYMIAEKNTEVSEKNTALQRENERKEAEQRMYRENIRAQKKAREQEAQSHRNQMLFQAGMGMLYLDQMNQANQSLRGIQQNTQLQNMAPSSYTVVPRGSGSYTVYPR